MKKKLKNMNIDKNIVAKIPYNRVIPEGNLIETKKGLYTKSYLLSEIKPEDVDKEELDLFKPKLEQLLNRFGEDVVLQFVCFNKLSEYPQNVLLPEDKTDSINRDIQLYNAVVSQNSEIGHNNIQQSKYVIVGIKTDTAEEAIERFKEIEEVLYQAFYSIFKIEAQEMDITDRLHVLYDMHNPGEEAFGKTIGMGTGEKINYDTLQRLKMTTKDIVAPQKFSSEMKLKNHVILNGNTYARSFFINSIPAKVAENFLEDLTNIVGNMIYSITMEPMNAAFGRDLAKQLVMDNTVIKTTKNRKTLEDRRNKTTIQTESCITNTEEDYFNKAALEVCNRASAKEQYIFACTAVIVLYADNLDELNNSSDLLRISASKFAVQVKSFDMQQLRGFQSALPLCNNEVDVKRVFPTEKAVNLIPLNLNCITKENGLYYGLNIFTDNLVRINRRNNPILSGMISGTGSAGKTYQMKREIFNALAGTEDDIIVISTRDREYDSFVRRYGGTVIEQVSYNPFSVTDGYALNEDAYHLKKTFLEGLYEISTDYTNDYMWQLKNNVDEFKAREEQVTEQIYRCINDTDGMLAERIRDYLSQLDENMKKALYFEKDMEEIRNRLTLYHADTVLDLFRLLDFLWIQSIENKKKNRNTWIFVDSMDELFAYPHVTEYIRTIMRYCNLIGTVFTFVLQDPAEMAVSENYAFDELVKSLGYIKLLNQGAKERQYFSSLLNIPQLLMQYISTAEQGHIGAGLIITDMNNIAFDDSFLHVSDPDMKAFHEIFAKEIDYNYIGTLSDTRERDS